MENRHQHASNEPLQPHQRHHPHHFAAREIRQDMDDRRSHHWKSTDTIDSQSTPTNSIRWVVRGLTWPLIFYFSFSLFSSFDYGRAVFIYNFRRCFQIWSFRLTTMTLSFSFYFCWFLFFSYTTCPQSGLFPILVNAAHVWKCSVVRSYTCSRLNRWDDAVISPGQKTGSFILELCPLLSLRPKSLHVGCNSDLFLVARWVTRSVTILTKNLAVSLYTMLETTFPLHYASSLHCNRWNAWRCAQLDNSSPICFRVPGLPRAHPSGIGPIEFIFIR